LIEGDGVAFTGPCTGKGGPLFMPLIRVARRFALYERIFPYFQHPKKRDVETYVRIVEAFVATAKRDDKVDTTVLFAPFEDAYIKGSGYTESQIVDALRKAGIDVLVDRLPKIANDDLYRIPDDGHPTALANRARAREIEDHLRAVDARALSIDDAASP
jgi:hypothetical protein